MAIHTDSSPVSCAQIAHDFPELIVQIIGNEKATVVRADDPNLADKDSLIFLSRPDATPAAIASKAGVLVVNNQTLERVKNDSANKTLIVVTDVDVSMAKIISRYFAQTPYQDHSWESPVHSTAVIHPSATLGEGVRVGPHAIISAGVQIGAGSFVGGNAVIEQNVVIGEATTIHPLAYIGHATQIGKFCEILPHTTVGKEGFGYGHAKTGHHYRIPHQGRVVIGDDVHIGANCTIDRGTFRNTTIGNGTKIDNLVHLAHNTTVGEGCVITAGFMMAGSSSLGNYVITGGKATVTGHIKIGDHVRLAGMAVATKDVIEPGDYGGFPLVPLQDNIKMRAALVHLSDMRKQVSQLMKKVFPE